MEAIEELKKKVENIEYKDIKELRCDISNMWLELQKNNLLTEQNVESNKSLSETMIVVKDTMIEMKQSVELSNKNNELLASNIETMNRNMSNLEDKMDTKFTEVDKEINKIDNKSKIDIVSLTKDWIAKLLIGGGLIAFIASQVIGK